MTPRGLRPPAWSYQLGLFADDAPLCDALGEFVHVYVDRTTRRPVPLPEKLRAVLALLCLPPPAPEERTA